VVEGEELVFTRDYWILGCEISERIERKKERGEEDPAKAGPYCRQLET
jgi:hypothetical protein